MSLSRLIDTSTMESEYANYHEAGIDSKIINADVNDISLQVGTLQAELNKSGFGTVYLDGKPIKAREMIIHTKAGEVTKVIIHTLP